MLIELDFCAQWSVRVFVLNVFCDSLTFSLMIYAVFVMCITVKHWVVLFILVKSLLTLVITNSMNKSKMWKTRFRKR